MNILNTLMFIGSLGLGEIIVILVVTLLLFVFPLVCLIDVVKSDFEKNNKLIWVLVILFLGFVGALAYLFVGRSQKIQK